MEQLPVPSKPSLPVAPPTLPPPAPTGRDPHPGLVIALPLLALGLFSSGATTWFGTDAGGAHAKPPAHAAIAVGRTPLNAVATVIALGQPALRTTSQTPWSATVTVVMARP
jgi:hypothetical protein